MNEKEEIRRVREQNRSLYEEVKKLKKSNTKLKKIISIAKNLNDEFLLKI